MRIDFVLTIGTQFVDRCIEDYGSRCGGVVYHHQIGCDLVDNADSEYQERYYPCIRWKNAPPMATFESHDDDFVRFLSFSEHFAGPANEKERNV